MTMLIWNIGCNTISKPVHFQLHIDGDECSLWIIRCLQKKHKNICLKAIISDGVPTELVFLRRPLVRQRDDWMKQSPWMPWN